VRLNDFIEMIFIIIPVFNRKYFTNCCLKSLTRQTFKDYKVIVVDDGSTDGTSEMITSEFPETILLKGDGNLWWAGATNAGVEYVLKNLNTQDSDYILTLNNDLELPEKYLEILISNASANKGSILGSVSLDIAVPDRMNYCGVSWNKFTGKYYSKAQDYNYSFQKLVKQKQVLCSDMLPGRGTLIPIKVFSEIGLYDSKNFPQYAADEDFSLRASRSGWKLLVPTQACVMSHIHAMGEDINGARFSLRYYKDLFFSIKSPLNLKIRYRWAMKNSPLKFFYFILDCLRIGTSVSLKSFQNLLRSSSNSSST